MKHVGCVSIKRRFNKPVLQLKGSGVFYLLLRATQLDWGPPFGPVVVLRDRKKTPDPFYRLGRGS